LDRARRTVEDQLGEDRARNVGPGELLEHDRRFDVTQAGAAPLLADRDAEQLGLAHRAPRRLRALFGLLAPPRPPRGPPARDVARELAQRSLVFGVGEGVGPPRDRGRLGCRCGHACHFTGSLKKSAIVRSRVEPYGRPDDAPGTTRARDRRAGPVAGGVW